MSTTCVDCNQNSLYTHAIITKTLLYILFLNLFLQLNPDE